MIANTMAAIVAFRPEFKALLALASQAKTEVALVVVFANSALEESLADALRAAGVEVIAAPLNMGLGEAFNQCAEAGRRAGMKRLFLLDQDSEPPAGLIGALSRTADALAARGDNPAVIGPRIVSPPGSNYKAPRYFARPGPAPFEAAEPVHYVISSGSLIGLEALERVGPFRADFFIDAIDTEWCFRAWAKGMSCWVMHGPAMAHRIGQGVVRKLGRAMPRQALFRLYAYVRNQSHCLTLVHVPFGWKLRISAHLARVVLAYWIEARFSPRFLLHMMQAAWRGLRGRLGPPPGAENAAPA